MADEKRIDLILRGHDQASRVVNRTTGAVTVFTGAVRTATASLATLLAPFAGFFVIRDTLQTFAAFEQQMARVQAVSGATAVQLGLLSDKAKQLGATTQFTASQSAEALGFFALAGFRVNEMLTAIGPTLQLAAAGQLDIAESADIVVKIMRGMGVESEDVANSVDVLTKAFTTANTDIRQLGDAMKFIAPVARAAGREIEEVTAAVQILSNAGLQAELSGTALRNIFLSLSRPTPKAQELLDQFGITALDTAGNVRPLADVLEQFQRALAGAGSGEKLRVFANIFEKRAATAFSALFEEGADQLREFETALNDAGGTGERVATIQMDTLRGGFLRLTSAIQSAQIQIGELQGSGLQDWLDQLAKDIGGLASAVQSFPVQFRLSVIENILLPISRGVDTLLFHMANFTAQAITAGVNIGIAFETAFFNIGVMLQNVFQNGRSILSNFFEFWKRMWQNQWQIVKNVGENMKDLFFAVFESIRTRSLDPFKNLTFTGLFEGTVDELQPLLDGIEELTRGTKDAVFREFESLTKKQNPFTIALEAERDDLRAQIEALLQLPGLPGPDEPGKPKPDLGTGAVAAAAAESEKGVEAVLLSNRFLGLAARFASPAQRLAERTARATEGTETAVRDMARAFNEAIDTSRYNTAVDGPGPGGIPLDLNGS